MFTLHIPDTHLWKNKAGKHTRRKFKTHVKKTHFSCKYNPKSQKPSLQSGKGLRI